MKYLISPALQIVKCNTVFLFSPVCPSLPLIIVQSEPLIRMWRHMRRRLTYKRCASLFARTHTMAEPFVHISHSVNGWWIFWQLDPKRETLSTVSNILVHNWIVFKPKIAFSLLAPLSQPQLYVCLSFSFE